MNFVEKYVCIYVHHNDKTNEFYHNVHKPHQKGMEQHPTYLGLTYLRMVIKNK